MGRMRITRRNLLIGSGGALAIGAAMSPTTAESVDRRKPDAFRFCLNTSTIRGQKLPLVEEIDIAAKAGYQGIEPWMGEIEEYLKTGGTMKDLATRIKDRGLAVASGIGFAEWIVDDDARRARGMEQAKRDMDLIAQLGSKHIAAPAAGAADVSAMDLRKIAERYRALMELGDSMGVAPMVEVWGFSKTLTKLSEASFVAIESGHPKACVLADVYHLYKGGSGIEGLRLLHGAALPVIHINDYPATPPPERIGDQHRVYPGDGIAPLAAFFAILKEIGFAGALSLELFNPQYYKQDALTVARTGLEKMRGAALKAHA